MKLNIEEKKILYAYGCRNHHNTVARLKWLAALTVDADVKQRLVGLARKIDREGAERWYGRFYQQLRSEMDGYFVAVHQMRAVENNTDWEGDLYDEAV